MRNVFGNVVSLLHIMGKMIAMGMPLEETISRVTDKAAALIRRPELGNLTVGACADVAVLKKIEGDFAFPDCGRVTLPGKYKLECFATVRAGDILFDPYGLAMDTYENAPESYWKDRFQVFV